MDSSDKKLLIALLVIFVVVFILLGLIGMAIRKLMEVQGDRIDREMGKAARTGTVHDPASFKALAKKKNHRIYFQESLIPVGLAVLGLLIFVFANTATGRWGDDLIGQFSTLFYRFDWSNPDNFHEFFGITLPCRFPPLMDDEYGGLPHAVADYWLAYTVMPIWIVSGVYYLVVSLGYVSRLLRTNKRASSIYDHHLESFNYFDAFALKGNPSKKEDEKKEEGKKGD